MILRSLSPLVLTFSIFSFTACAPRSPEVLSANHPLSFGAFQILEIRPVASADCTTQPLTQFDNHSCQEMRQEFRYVVYVGTQVYCYWALKHTLTDTDFDAAAKALETKITDAVSYTEYYAQVLKPWAALFRDGHVNAMPPDDLSKFEIYTSGAKLRVLAAGTDHESVVIASSTNSSLPAGARITQINGEPIAQRLATAADRTSGSTERMRRYFAGAKLLDATGLEVSSQPFTVSFIDPKSGQEKSVTPSRQVELDLPPAPGASSVPAEKTGAESVEAAILAGNIGYLKINAFVGSRIAGVIDAAMARLKNTNGLILDVRENGGGDQSGDRVLRWLSQQPVVRYIESPRHADFLLALRPDYLTREVDADPGFYTWRAVIVAPTSASEGTYAGKPITVLTSPQCFSACDTFVSALQSNHLGLVVGEATGGGTGSPLVFDLPLSSMKFRYAVARGKTSQGTFIESTGTLPDVLVEAVAGDLVRPSIETTQAQAAYAQIQKQLGLSGGTPPVPVVTMGHTVDLYVGVSATREELMRLRALADIREN